MPMPIRNRIPIADLVPAVRTSALTLALTAGALAPMAGLAAADTPGPLDDEEIRSAVHQALMRSPQVLVHRVDVRVDDGEVTLAGTVDNLMAKRHAEMVATKVKGVLGVDNDLLLPSTDRSTAQIEEDVESALLQNDTADSFEISVEVDGNTVMLGGESHSWQEREMAIHAARSVRGVHQVVSEIAIEYDMPRSESDIEADVESAVAMDPRLQEAFLEFSVDEGVVSVSGKVGSLYEKGILRSHCWTNGTEAVDLEDVSIAWWLNDEQYIGVMEPTTKPDDQALADAIRAAIADDPLLQDDGISVRVADGKAYLYGAVDTMRDRLAAKRAARSIKHIERVANMLSVQPEVEPHPGDLADSVRSVIERDTWVEADQVEAEVIDDTVYLEGTVPSDWVHQHVEELASSIVGVDRIVNRLQVEDVVGDVSREPYYRYDYGFSAGYDVDYAMEEKGVPEPGLSDPALEQEIRDEFFWSPFVDDADIDVDVVDGVAHLDGTVADWDECWRARANAFEGGARRVMSADLEIAAVADE